MEGRPMGMGHKATISIHNPQTTGNERTYTHTTSTHRPIRPRGRRIGLRHRSRATAEEGRRKTTPRGILLGDPQ
jgi:hypothetical protein